MAAGPEGLRVVAWPQVLSVVKGSAISTPLHIYNGRWLHLLVNSKYYKLLIHPKNDFRDGGSG